MADLIELRDGMRRFTEERDWSRFHDPKSLILALVGEVGELSELFQWLASDQAAEQAQHQPLRRRVEDEMSDVLLYLVRLADVLEIDLGHAAEDKLVRSSAKHVPGASPHKVSPT